MSEKRVTNTYGKKIKLILQYWNGIGGTGKCPWFLTEIDIETNTFVNMHMCIHILPSSVHQDSLGTVTSQK